MKRAIGFMLVLVTTTVLAGAQSSRLIVDTPTPGGSLLTGADTLFTEEGGAAKPGQPADVQAPAQPGVDVEVASRLVDPDAQLTTRDTFEVAVSIYYSAPPALLEIEAPAVSLPDEVKTISTRTKGYTTVRNGRSSDCLETIFTLRARVAGSWEIGPFEVVYTDRSNQAVGQANAAAVTVDVNEYRPPLAVKVLDYGPHIAIALVIFAMIVGVIVWRRTAKYRAIQQEPEVDSRQQWAAMLEEARRARLAGSHGEYYTLLMRVVQQAWQEKVGQPLPEPTSDRFEQVIAQTGASADMVSRLADFLTDCQAIRFAPAAPADRELDRAESEARFLAGIQ